MPKVQKPPSNGNRYDPMARPTIIGPRELKRRDNLPVCEPDESFVDDSILDQSGNWMAYSDVEDEEDDSIQPEDFPLPVLGKDEIEHEEEHEQPADFSDLIDESVLRGQEPSSSPPPAAPSQPKGYLLRVFLQTMSPPRITRILRVLADFTFSQLHQVLQIAFRWDNSHLWEFTLHATTIEATLPLKRLQLSSDPDAESANDYTLRDIFESGESVYAIYHYDFDDEWEHFVNFMGVADENLAASMGMEQDVFCVGGEGAPSCEDCGGVIGFEELKQLFKDPKKVDVYDRREWYRASAHGADLDPWKWDLEKVNRRLRRLEV